MIVVSVALTRESGRDVVGDLLVYRVEVADLDGFLTSGDTPTITVTPPSGLATHPTADEQTTGEFRFSFVPALAGRHLVVAATGSFGLADDAVYVNSSVAGGSMPTALDVFDYLGANSNSWSEGTVQEALDAEAAAQRKACRVGATYEADLREALLRRVQRNLELRNMPVGILTTSDGDASMGIRLGRNDPEVSRLEAPYRRLIVAAG